LKVRIYFVPAKAQEGEEEEEEQEGSGIDEGNFLKYCKYQRLHLPVCSTLRHLA